MSRGKFLPDAVGAVAGVAFAILMLLALASVDPLREATDDELIAWWTDGGNVRDTYLSTYFMLASVPCFLVFLAVLRGRLAGAGEGAEPVANFVFGTGVCFATVLLVGDAVRGVVAHSVRFEDEALPAADMLRYLTSLWTLLFGMVAIPAAAIMIGAASWIVLRSRVFSVWLGVAGAVVVAGTAVAVALLAGPWASPLIQLWVVAASFELWRTRQVEAPSARQAPVLTRTGDVLSQ